MNETISGGCLGCNKPLSILDGIPIQFQNTSLALRHFCLACKFNIPYIEHIVCQKCSAYMRCYNECNQMIELEQNFSSIQYTDVVKEWMKRFKFDGDMRVGEALRPLLSLAIARYRTVVGMSKAEPYLTKGLFSYRDTVNCCNIVTSVPISQQRLVERGFNQAEYLARHVAKRLNAPYYSLLYRINDFQHNSHLSRIERGQSVKNKFFFNTSAVPLLAQYKGIVRAIQTKQPINIIIVDDIYTTGYTLRACASELTSVLGDGITLYGLTLARA